MKNLENYGVQALDAKEIRVVDGGSVAARSLLDGSLYLAASAVHAVVDFFSGAIDRFNKYRD
ncbi:hypothetical protein [Lutibacter sp.]